MKRLIPLIGLMCAMLALPASSSAHGASPLHQAVIQAGPYTLDAGFFHWPVRSEQAADLLLTPANGRYRQRELTLQAWLIPGPGTPGEPIALTVLPDPDNADAYSLPLHATVKGDWTLQILVRGPDGNGQATLALPVSGPPAIPLWLGWSIGLLPVLGLIGFALRQAWVLSARMPQDRGATTVE